MTAQYLLEALAQPVSSPIIDALLSNIAQDPVVLTRKDFKSTSYRSSQEYGISLQCEQDQSVAGDEWVCQAIDIYNEEAVKGWSSFPRLPVEVDLLDHDGKKVALHLAADTTGGDLVRQLGEPQRKGGGEPMKGGGASGLGPGVWLEWSMQHSERAIVVMIELAGQAARGRDRWDKDRAGAARWGVCTLAVAD